MLQDTKVGAWAVVRPEAPEVAMREGLYVTDFHAHLRGTDSNANCHSDPTSDLFLRSMPLFERIAGFSEPIHDSIVRWMAINYRDRLSRQIYGSLAQLALMEALRLFKVYGVECLIESMDRNGIDHSVVHALDPFIRTQDVLDAVRPYRDRISVFASVARNEPNGVDYLEKHLMSGEINGLKIHPIIGGYACNELYEKTKDVVALAVERDLPIMIHTGHIPGSHAVGLAAGCNEVRAVEPLVAAFPRGRFVLAHIGYESWRYILDLAERHPNVCVETSWQPAKVIRRAVDELGPHRVLFGSDFPLFKQSQAMRLTREAVTGKEFVCVASTNASRILRRSGGLADVG